MAYVLPKIITQDKKTFMYKGAKLWNSLDVDMRSIECNDKLANLINIFCQISMQ